MPAAILGVEPGTPRDGGGDGGTRRVSALEAAGRRIVRAAVVQAAPVAFDREATLERVASWTARAATGGAELVVFPEAFVGGYPKRADFGARVGSRTAEGREWFRRYHEAAVEIPGPAVDRLGEIARTSGVHLVIGVIERSGGRSTARRCSSGPTAASSGSTGSSCRRRWNG